VKQIVFDIETIPDLDFGKKFLNLEGLNDEDIGKSMFFQQQQKTGIEFLPYDLHQIIAISILTNDSGNLDIKSLKLDKSYNEKSILLDAFKIHKESDILISWNGLMFDLPVLNCRSLKNLTKNTFLSGKHIDLKNLLSNNNINNISSLDRISKGLKYPGKKLSSGAKVWDLYLNGNIQEISDYCTIDVLNTYLLFVHYEFITGVISEGELHEKNTILKQFLESHENKALNTFALEISLYL